MENITYTLQEKQTDNSIRKDHTKLANKEGIKEEENRIEENLRIWAEKAVKGKMGKLERNTGIK